MAVAASAAASVNAKACMGPAGLTLQKPSATKNAQCATQPERDLNSKLMSHLMTTAAVDSSASQRTATGKVNP